MTKVNPSARRKARRRALQALYQWQLTGNALTEIEIDFHAEQDMKKVDMDYFHELLHQIPQSLDEIDAHFTPYL